MSSVYQHLPTKFDYTQYYLNQAAGGPSFPVYRARQRGGSFLAPFILKHGIPFLKWIGRQAATLATGVGGAYLDKGKLSKDDMKALLSKQGKQTAHSVLDKIKQQVGSGTMTHRRDARLSTLVPLSTETRDGILTNHHRLRPPSRSEGFTDIFNKSTASSMMATNRKRKRKSKSKAGAKKKPKTTLKKKKQKSRLTKKGRKTSRKRTTPTSSRKKAAKQSSPQVKSKGKSKSASSSSNRFKHTIFS